MHKWFITLQISGDFFREERFQEDGFLQKGFFGED
jgi:hypothetical protein